jgi:alanyl-tRNA synthetase
MKLSEQDKMQLGLKLAQRGRVVNLQPCQLSYYHQPGLTKQQLKKINKLAKETIKHS